MTLLILFALVAGAGTAFSPCVLPILPVVLSAGVTGGRRRPLGVVTGIVTSFTFTVIALVYVIEALGLPQNIARIIAVVVLVGFGVSLLVPAIGDRIEAWISRFAPGPARRAGEGFGSGFLVGVSLGFVYAPCAGPILAGVITASATQDFNAGRLAVAFAYALGSGAMLYALMLGGRRFTDRLAGIRGRMQVAMGAVMVIIGIAIATNLDTRFQTAIADSLPAFLVNPTGSLEQSDAVASPIRKVRGGGPPIVADATKLDQALDLPVYGQAPEFVDNQRWFNTPGGAPLTVGGLRGQVVLIDFWTYTCINCIRTFPYLRAWDRRYRDQGLTIVGIHSPEFPFERDEGNVADAIAQNGLAYPVVQDNNLSTWTAWGNQFWPAKYLIDARGQVRYAHFGEGSYDETERAIRTLLHEAGQGELGAGARAAGETASVQTTTPETYLGSARAAGYANGPIESGVQDFGVRSHSLARDQSAYRGRWEITHEDATAVEDAGLDLQFNAKRVFLVLGSEGHPGTVQVRLDGKPISARDAGDDVRRGRAKISGYRLYRLVDLLAAGTHRLELDFDPGISGYAFTFG